jgi:hypothetical protein
MCNEVWAKILHTWKENGGGQVEGFNARTKEDVVALERDLNKHLLKYNIDADGVRKMVEEEAEVWVRATKVTEALKKFEDILNFLQTTALDGDELGPVPSPLPEPEEIPDPESKADLDVK